MYSAPSPSTHSDVSEFSLPLYSSSFRTLMDQRRLHSAASASPPSSPSTRTLPPHVFAATSVRSKGKQHTLPMKNAGSDSSLTGSDDEGKGEEVGDDDVEDEEEVTESESEEEEEEETPKKKKRPRKRY